MLYTTMPWEAIFPNRSDPDPTALAVILDGPPVLIHRGRDGRARIERLLSTDPADYLDERFLPETPVDWWF